jgi:CDGSH-type Zn-finger protein
MAALVTAQKSPFSVDVMAGRTHLWCACGRSKRRPETVWFCGCKNTKSAPLCDGTHETLAI